MKRYFYMNSEGEQKGTFTVEDLRNEPIKKETLVWTQGMPRWEPAREVADLQPLFEVIPTAHSEYGSTTPTQQQANYDQTTAYELPVKPKTWVVESILVTILPFILCGNVFSLLGIVAIVNASKVESLFNSGLFVQSKEASDKAARWTKITLWIAIGAILLAIIGIVLFLTLFGSMAGLENHFM